ncbi:hypothetical protein Anapl_01292 [Anas platyrhynchos]|uniref:Uncharacterized protein n=1 Tax=Anas platyrhynchos TaxID=8839 RepID=R0LYI7_ANAPL|nr:hypothetical protein Anapl_01292 [Anas platyrhynchos]
MEVCICEDSGTASSVRTHISPQLISFPTSCIIGSASAQKLGRIGSESIILRHLCTASTCPLEKWLRTEQGKRACKQGLVPPTLLRLCRDSPIAGSEGSSNCLGESDIDSVFEMGSTLWWLRII